jgi:hypothetical protein
VIHARHLVESLLCQNGAINGQNAFIVHSVAAGEFLFTDNESLRASKKRAHELLRDCG